jgi:hypothetical protein
VNKIKLAGQSHEPLRCSNIEQCLKVVKEELNSKKKKDVWELTQLPNEEKKKKSTLI